MTNGSTDPEQWREWQLHQAMVVLSGVLIVLVGLGYRWTAPHEHDPFAHRVGFLIAATGLAVAEWRLPAIRRWGNTLAFLLGASFVAWFVWTAALAGFSVGRVIGLFTLQFAGTVLFRLPTANLAWQLLMVGLCLVGVRFSDQPAVSPGMLLTAMTTLASMGTMASLFRDAMLTELAGSRRALTDANDQLEDRVRARTEALSREVAERRAAEERAALANQVKGRFLANMSHELRTPLNAIVGYTELVREDLPTDGAATADLRRVLDAATHLRSLIDDLLDLTRVEAGELSLRREVVGLRQVVSEAVSAAGLPLSRSGNTVVLELPDPSTTVRADGDRVRQILVNLLDNAAKFTSGGTITVTAAVSDAVRISVRDTGIGIPPDQVARLFDRFTQLDESPTRRFGGVGLGLAVSQRLAQLQGGWLEVRSVPREGSTFTLVLPATPPSD